MTKPLNNFIADKRPHKPTPKFHITTPNAPFQKTRLTERKRRISYSKHLYYTIDTFIINNRELITPANALINGIKFTLIPLELHFFRLIAIPH